MYKYSAYHGVGRNSARAQLRQRPAPLALFDPKVAELSGEKIDAIADYVAGANLHDNRWRGGCAPVSRLKWPT